MESSWEQRWKETQDVHQRINGQLTDLLKISADFGLLIVRSAIVLNGGALLALPAYFSAVKNAELLNSTELLTAAVWFIVGIILAILTSYCGYVNFQANAHVLMAEREKEILEIEEGYDTTHKHRLAKDRKFTREYWQKSEEKGTKFVNWTLWLAQIFGFGSYIAFIVGSYCGGLAMTAG